jgi:Winged helix DNA-binding domain
MAKIPTPTVSTLRLLRQEAQLLSRRQPLAAVDVVHHLLGVQAQIYSASHLAIRARSPVPREADVEDAVTADRSIVWTWAMRGTLHLITAEDFGWLVPLTARHGVPNALRRLQQEGVPADQIERAVRLTASFVAGKGPATRNEIAEAITRAGIRIEGQAAAALVWLAAARGLICHGPPAQRGRAFVSVSDWLQTGQRPADERAALGELAVRYLRAHGPATPSDLARWAGITSAHARAGWSQIGKRIREVSVTGTTMWMLKSQEFEVSSSITRLAPAFEEFLLGWKDRSFAVTKSLEHKIVPGGGMVRPAIVHDGKVIGGWSLQRNARSVRIVVEPAGRLGRAIRDALQDESDDIGRFLEIQATLAGQDR